MTRSSQFRRQEICLITCIGGMMRDFLGNPEESHSGWSEFQVLGVATPGRSLGSEVGPEPERPGGPE